jgi:hypothetical protein
MGMTIIENTVLENRTSELTKQVVFYSFVSHSLGATASNDDQS